MPRSEHKHPILNPTGEYADKPSLYDHADKDSEDYNKFQQFKASATPADVINLITGRYGHSASSTDDMAGLLEDHPHNNPRNLDIALRRIAGRKADIDENESRMQALLQHFQVSPKMIDKVIDIPEQYGMRTKNDKGRMRNRMASFLSHQKGLTPEHVNKMLNHDAEFEVDRDFLQHPAVNLTTQKKIAETRNARLTSSAIEELLENHSKYGNLGDKPDDLLYNLAARHPHMGADTLDKIADRMSPEARTEMFDRLLGIKGGKTKDDSGGEEANNPDSDYHWENWSEGPDYSPLAAEIASSKHLNDAQANHIMRHGEFDDKWNLLHNDKINPKHADQMYEKWLNDDSHHGYNKDALNEKIKEENPFEYDDWYEDATNEAQEDYPLSTHINDAGYDDSIFMNGKDKEDWIDEKLEGDHDWNHTPEKKPGDTEEPEEQDFSGRDKEDHPEYQKRYDEAEAAYEKELEHNKSHEVPEQVYNDYDEGLSDSIYSRAQDLYDKKMDDAHEDPEFLPSHLTSIQEIKRKQAEKKQQEAFEQAAAKEREVQPKLNQYIPNRKHEHEYGENQHHMEMAKQYADANGGSIDIGRLNKMHPNMVEKWKKIFGGKGKLSSDEIQSKIDANPKTKYNLSYGHWKPDDMQNVNGHDEMVIRLDHSPESLAELKKDPETYETFQKINDVSQRSGHPTNHNTIGWARVDFSNPKHPMIDELQSDFSSAARDYLAEHGESGQSKAAALDKIMKIQKNWRENLLNAVTKIARDNGAEKISTHSPESKSAHTGSSKVHSVYKDSYEKIPRSMGFRSADMDSLPLSEEGKKVFMTARTGTPVEKLLEDHLAGLDEHAKMWHKHADLARDPVEDRFTDAHIALAEHHANMYKQHQQRVEQLDPTHPIRNAKAAFKYISGLERQNAYPLDVQSGKRDQAVLAAKGVTDFKHEMPIYGFDSALKEAPEAVAAHTGHTLPLQVEAVKKTMMAWDMLMKSGMKDNDKVAVAQALMNIKQQQEAIEGLKTSNPEAYSAISELTQVLVDLFKELTNEPIEATEHQLEVEAQMAPPEEGGQQPNVKPPPEEKPITHGSKELPIGAIREYDPQNVRQKTPDGKWIGIGSGQKRSEFQ